jgi:hypothetical protein
VPADDDPARPAQLKPEGSGAPSGSPARSR